ncbi:uncharacterized protein LOC112885543 [Panicum hallii]|uniref:uncharacterized protein LOC112885543 n=1 Tax=Panicum hallii TaxID=206008 RepID=UPI000DF4ECB2|nr:uncharacterized protein LOC112885543 [Panicum hallii]
MESFNFVFIMKMMLKLFRITNELSQCLQRRDQNIVQAMSLLVDVKARLADLRSNGWEELFAEVQAFCDAKKIEIPSMDAPRPRWGCSSLAVKMVETERHIIFPLVYRLIELALLLPVATTSVERVFSVMKIIKTERRNKMDDDWLNDLMICYNEKEIFKGIDDEAIMKRFQALKHRRMNFSRPTRHTYPRLRKVQLGYIFGLSTLRLDAAATLAELRLLDLRQLQTFDVDAPGLRVLAVEESSYRVTAARIAAPRLEVLGCGHMGPAERLQFDGAASLRRIDHLNTVGQPYTPSASAGGKCTDPWMAVTLETNLFEDSEEEPRR